MSTDRGMPVKRDANIQDVENDEFPILCETCLGNNPYVRMIRVPYGKGCTSCGRPFTNFRWKAGTDARYKSTQVCQMCAKTKNVCQCCVLDLTFGLPTQVRDTFLARQQVLTMPIEKANRAVYMQEMEKKVLPPYRALFVGLCRRPSLCKDWSERYLAQTGSKEALLPAKPSSALLFLCTRLLYTRKELSLQVCFAWLFSL